MLSSAIPTKFQVPWASSAGGGFITTPIPLTTASPGRASLQQGFPPTTFEPEASGGNPPWGADANGILNMATAWLQWAQAGGGVVPLDTTFQGQIGGYPLGAMVASLTLPGHYWQSTAESNASNPDGGGAGWRMFPDVFIQQQAGNYAATDSGSANAYAITLSPIPTSWASIVGAPLRFLAGAANTVTNPTLNVNGLGPKTMINTDGTALGLNQISRAGQLVEGFYDGTSVQVTSPPKSSATPAATGLQSGMILLCPKETPFVGTLECDGSIKNIVDYPNLFNVIGTKYGGNGTTTFGLPDLRGAFVRGWDHGRGLDQDSVKRTSQPLGLGSLVGDHVGGWETQGLGNAIKISEPTINFPATTWHDANFNQDYTVPAASYKVTLALDTAIISTPTGGPFDLSQVSGIYPQVNDLNGVLRGVYSYPTAGGLTKYGGFSGLSPTWGSVGYSAAMLIPNQGFNNLDGQMLQNSNIVSVTIGWLGGTDANGSSDVRGVNIAMMYVIVY